jgi:hypothetical protein
MPICTSGRHTWNDLISAARCCNGWHRELRLDGPEPADNQEGWSHVSDLPEAPKATFVWVKDGNEHQEDHER